MDIYTDASAEGLAGMMLQGVDGRLHLVNYVSKRTSEAERHYHSSKLELLAIVWTLERLRQFHVGIEFTIITDCQALVYLNSQRTKNPQMCSQLQEFAFQIKHRAVDKIQHIDPLSRALGPNLSIEEIELERGSMFVINVITHTGTAFTSKKFEEFCKEISIQHNRISVRHPRANGMVEQVNRPVIPVIRSEIEEEDCTDWDKKINLGELAINFSINQTTNLSPFKMLYGYQPIIKGVDAQLREFLLEKYTPPGERQNVARERMRKIQGETKKRFDKKMYRAAKFNLGDIVYLRSACKDSKKNTTKIQRPNGNY